MTVVLHEFSQFPLIVVFVKSTAGNVPEAVSGGNSLSFGSKHQLTLVASCCRFTLTQLNGNRRTTLQQDVRCGNGSHALGIHVILMPSHQNQDLTGGDVLTHDNTATLFIIIRNLIIIHFARNGTVLNQNTGTAHGVLHGIFEHGVNARAIGIDPHKATTSETNGPQGCSRVRLDRRAVPDCLSVPAFLSLWLRNDNLVGVLHLGSREDALFDFAVGRVVVGQAQFHKDGLSTTVDVLFVDDVIFGAGISIVPFLSPHVSRTIVSAIFLSCPLQVMQGLIAFGHDVIVRVHTDVHTVDAVVDSLIEALPLYDRGYRRHRGNRRAAIVAGDEMRVIRGQRLRGLRPIRGRGRKRFMMVVHFYTSQYNKVGTQTGIIRLLPILYHRDVKKSTMSFTKGIHHNCMNSGSSSLITSISTFRITERYSSISFAGLTPRRPSLLMVISPCLSPMTCC